jgi:multiple sugar transport system permease protein
MTRKSTFQTISFYVIATFIAFIVMIPFFWMIITSLKDSGALLIVPVEWIPKNPSIQAYKDVFTLFPFGRSIGNSLFIAISSTVVSLLSASMAAFVFAKMDFKGREVLFKIYLATMMIPFQVMIIPRFVVMKELQLPDTYVGLILPQIFNAFAVFLLRQQMKSISSEYMDAALIDGASNFRIFFSLIIPLSSGTLATLGLITFMGEWNSYLWPLIMISDKNKMTLPIALGQLNGQYASDYNLLMAGSLISIIPIIIIYLFGQRYMKSGLQMGGVKG